ncbi:MAG: rod shape-determining protein [Clostridia bacterium]|nr:rod shape-determining protein [Clostridia bacterium]
MDFLIRKTLGIDLGTASCLVYKDGGIVVNEPSVVAVDADTDEVICIGKEAQGMIGRTPANIRTIRPLRDGVISQYNVTLSMLDYFIKQAFTKNGRVVFHPKPKVVVCIPSGITEVEERAVVDAAKNAGASEVFLIEEPVAAAIGAGIDISEPTGNMIVDIGGGTTDIAVIALDGVVVSESIKVAGDKFNEAVIKYVRSKYNVLIGEQTAERVKIEIGNVFRHNPYITKNYGGRCLAQGVPKNVTLSSAEMLEAMLGPIQSILDAICQVIERTPPELISDITRKGIVMTGGGANLKGFAELITEFTGIRTVVAKDPINCVAKGTGKSIGRLNLISEGSINVARPGSRQY